MGAPPPSGLRSMMAGIRLFGDMLGLELLASADFYRHDRVRKPG
jgi:hypothetical protein